MAGEIVVRGARVHNLKNIDLEIPRDRLVVITGVSGSGKSSLAFDTLFAEGQRRYLESLGADARQLLKQIAKPEVDLIDGLSPAIAIQQKAPAANPRSTVGTMTDIYDFLRLLFARVGQSHCPKCGAEINALSIDQMVDRLMQYPEGSRVLILAPVRFSGAAALQQGLRELARQGFTRVMAGGETYELGGDMPMPFEPRLDVDLVVDRLAIRPGAERRLADSLELAAKAGQQVVKISAVDEPNAALLLTQKFVCTQCATPSHEPTLSLFSFNSPQGACAACQGSGVAPPRGKGKRDDAEPRHCGDCGGSRLSPASLTVRINGKNIAHVAALPLNELKQFLVGIKWSARHKAVAVPIVDEIDGRLHCLAQLGLDYLSVDRASTTLSGGEAQRVRLATQIGAGMAGVLYILDEPSIGLHQRDNQKLIDLLCQLRDGGNSVVVVEHDPETIMAADYVVDMGPGAGVRGGRVVARGTPDAIVADAQSLTGRFLAGVERVHGAVKPRELGRAMLRLANCSRRNLKNLDVEFPIGALTCVTGVSGAGKSTLVMEVLQREVMRRLAKKSAPAGADIHLTGWQHFDRVIAIDQEPIGRTPRSNAATYTGIFDHLRELFAQLPEARVRGYTAQRFSFNVSGGRCESCSGEGVTRVDMQFLPELYVTCEACQGRRFNRETLEIKYKGLNIAEVLDLPVLSALELLGAMPSLYSRLLTLQEVGLGYLRLGQPASTLSGGEAQRVKLAGELARRTTGRSLYVLDEPTTGLHFEDIRKLLQLLQRLVDLGNTMVIVEHNLDVIAAADHVIDLGPEGGASGGQIVACGPPRVIAASPRSHTGRYLAEKLPSNAT